MIKDYKSGHRERVRDKFLDSPALLRDDEILEAMLFGFIPRRDTKPLAKILIEKYGGLPAVQAAHFEELAAVPGMTRTAAVGLKLNHEANMRRLAVKMSSEPIFHDFDAVKNYCILRLCREPREVFLVLYLDRRRQLIKAVEHARGSVKECAFYAEEIVREAANLRSSFVVIVHNHPSVMGSFSDRDKQATRAIRTKLNILDIDVYDHILVQGGEAYSGREHFLFED
ncbi:MAG: DNA repair protein RadC [Rickettsiales bacterium]|jgi:DNA repair protein RadC|nr:DNA repair protein RadC [Rickettsiales bacterium]